jgi:hypothetical protein
MKKIELPFNIGCAYEKWEFSLEISELYKFPYDKYLYVGKVKKFMNLIPERTELVFYWDRLEIVILSFLNMNMTSFTELSNSLEELLGKPEIENLYGKTQHIFTKRNVAYKCLLYPDNSLLVIYGTANKLCFWDVLGK